MHRDIEVQPKDVVLMEQAQYYLLTTDRASSDELLFETDLVVQMLVVSSTARVPQSQCTFLIQ